MSIMPRNIFTIGASALQLVDHYSAVKKEHEDISNYGLWTKFLGWASDAVARAMLVGRGDTGTICRRKAAKHKLVGYSCSIPGCVTNCEGSVTEVQSGLKTLHTAYQVVLSKMASSAGCISR